MAKAFDHRLTREKCLIGVCSLTKCRKGGGGILAVRLGADGRAEHVVEVRSALGGRNRVAARPLAGPSGASLRSRLPSETKFLRRISDVRLVYELLVTALDKREAVPEEGFGCWRGGDTAPYRCGGELAVGVAGESAAAANRRRRQPDAWIVALPHHAIDA